MGFTFRSCKGTYIRGHGSHMGDLAPQGHVVVSEDTADYDDWEAGVAGVEWEEATGAMTT